MISKFITTYLALLVLLPASAIKALELYSYLNFQSAQIRFAAAFSGASEGITPATFTGPATEGPVFFEEPNYSLLYAKALYNIAFNTRSIRRKNSLLCRSEEYVYREIQNNPFNTEALVNWASIVLERGEEPCTVRADPYEVLRFSFDLNKNDDKLLFVSSLLHFDHRRRNEGKEVLNQLLRLDPNLREEQLSYISSHVRTSDDVLTMIPAQFPILSQFSTKFLGEDSSRQSDFREALGEKQITAINALPNSNNLPIETRIVIIDTLRQLEPVLANDSVRMAFDKKLSSYFSDNNEAGRYLRDRSALTSLEVLRAKISKDTKPSENNLFNWEVNDEVQIDDYYTSVGFVTDRPESIKLIELSGTNNSAHFETAMLKVLGSNDNKKFNDITKDFTIKAIDLYSEPVIGLWNTNEAKYRFWKINYHSPLHNGRFGTTLNRLIKAYGQ